MAEPVLLISSDPFLGASLDAIAGGRVRLARLEPSRRPAAWPGEPGATVVLDVSARQRDAAYTWVRRHHPGPLIVLLKPGERDPALPPDPNRLVIRRPFRLGDLVAILEHPPSAEATARAAREVEAAGVAQAAGVEAAMEVAATTQVAEAPVAEVAEAGVREAGVAEAAEGQGGGAGPASQDLLMASTEQRRRRLGSLATPAPAGRLPKATPGQPARTGAPGPTPAGQAAPPTSADRARAAPTPEWRRGRRVVARVLVGVAVLLAVVAAWLAFGLLDAREDLAVVGGAVRDELTRAEVALERGDLAAARTAVRAAGRNLDVAEAVSERRELRIAARLPVLSGVVADVEHLLAGGRHLVGGGERAVAAATRLRPGRAAALRGGRFDLDDLGAASRHGRRLLLHLERARAELEQVRGGPLARGAGETRRWALARLAGTYTRVRALVPALEALPTALGADRPRTYLVVLADPPAALPAAGGAVAGLEVVADDGVLDIRPGGEELAQRLEDAGAAAHLPTAARALLGAGPAGPDGVVAVDPLGAGALLEATGPVDVPGWGRLDAAGAPGLGAAGRPARELLLGALLGRVLAAPDLVATGQALRTAGADGHLRVFAADPGLQRVLARHHLDAATTPDRR